MNSFASDLSDMVRHVDDVNCMHNVISNCPAIEESWGSYFQGFFMILLTVLGSAVVVNLCGERRHIHYDDDMCFYHASIMLCFIIRYLRNVLNCFFCVYNAWTSC